MKRPRGLAWFAPLLLAGAVALSGGSDALGTSDPTARLATGRLLVARPGMTDPNFAETVVLLLSYGDEGALGVIVNRPTRVPLSHVLPEVGRLAERPEVVFRGGPVALNQMIFALRTSTLPPGCQPVLDDVCAGGSLELVERALGTGPAVIEFRGFAGYAGWAPGQLEWEIEQQGWYVVSGTSRRVFDGPPDELWADLVRLAESPVA